MAFLMHMLLNGRDPGIFIGGVLWLLLNCSFSFGVDQSDINCLKSIKASLQDTLGYFNSSWDFNNNTEGFICNFLGIECWESGQILNIRLSDLGLKGSFPKGVANCTSLTGLDLSSNQLNGPLPTDIDKIIAFITTLDLSSNSFTGQIPMKLSNCSYLNVLKLDNNKFSGIIPPELGQLARIKIFSVANNQLSGQVPTFNNNTSITVDSYANNPGLCGAPLKQCQGSAKKPISFVKVLSSNNVVIAAAAGFGFGFPFSFSFFLARAPSVRYLVVFARRFKS